MMKQEFEALAGYEVSTEDYNKIIEPMYMATALTKEEFVKTISKKRFALKPLKSIIKEMKQSAKIIEAECTVATPYIEWGKLYKLVEEYIGRKYGETATYVSHENEKFTCYYPKSIEIYGRKDYKTIEVINLI
jgi:hypothetical protein